VLLLIVTVPGPPLNPLSGAGIVALYVQLTSGAVLGADAAVCPLQAARASTGTIMSSPSLVVVRMSFRWCADTCRPRPASGDSRCKCRDGIRATGSSIAS
jgi:hypothetical protein